MCNIVLYQLNNSIYRSLENVTHPVWQNKCNEKLITSCVCPYLSSRQTSNAHREFLQKYFPSLNKKLYFRIFGKKEIAIYIVINNMLSRTLLRRSTRGASSTTNKYKCCPQGPVQTKHTTKCRKRRKHIKEEHYLAAAAFTTLEFMNPSVMFQMAIISTIIISEHSFPANKITTSFIWVL